MKEKTILYHRSLFSRFATRVSRLMGHPLSFIIALLIIIIWASTGWFFHFSDTWQLVINTSTTIITFLMVFLIQNSQNRDSQAMQLKLDELIRAVDGAHNALLNLEELTEIDLDRIRMRYIDLAQKARIELQKGGIDTDSPEILTD